MSQNKLITEHFSRLKYIEIKNLPKSIPSRPLDPERPPKQYLVKFTPNPVDSFDMRHTGHSQNSRFDSLEHSEHLKRAGRQSNPGQQRMSDYDYEQNQDRAGFGAQDSFKRMYAPPEERHQFFSVVAPRIQVFSPNEDYRVGSAVKTRVSPGTYEEFGLDSSHSHNRTGEHVKRSNLPQPREVDFPEKANLVNQIEVLEGEVKSLREHIIVTEGDNKRLRDVTRNMEQEIVRGKALADENMRLNEVIRQYQGKIPSLENLEHRNQEIELRNKALTEEIGGYKHKIEDYEFRLAEYRELEPRLQSGFEEKLRAEREKFNRIREELEQMKGLEEKFFQIQAEKVSLEEEIDQIRRIKLTLESQLDRLRVSYEDIQEEVEKKVHKDYEGRLTELRGKLEVMTRELNEKEVKMRAYFDRETQQILASNRELQEQLRMSDERNKRSPNAERMISELKEKLSTSTIELDHERSLRIELEVKFRAATENYQRLKEDFERLRIELSRKPDFSEKERLLPQVVQELEKVNIALKKIQQEREGLLTSEAALRQDNVALNLKLNELTRRLGSLTDENQTLKASLVSMVNRGELELVSVKLGEALQVIVGLKGENELLRRERDGFKVRITELDRSLQEMDHERKQERREKEDLKLRLSELERALQEMDHDRKQERAKRSGIDSTRKMLEEENVSLKREIDVVQMKCNDLVSKLRELDNVASNLSLELEAAQRERTDVSRENADLKAKLNESMRAMTLLRQDFEGLLREKEGVSAKLRELDSVGFKRRGIEEELRMVKLENNQMIEKRRGIEEELRMVKLENSQMIEKRRGIEEELRMVKLENSQMIEKRRGIEEELRMIRLENTQMIEKRRGIEEELRMVRLENSQMVEKRRGIEEELRMVRLENSQMVEKIRELEQNLVCSTTPLEDEITRLLNENASLLITVRELKEGEGSKNPTVIQENKALIEQILKLSQELQAWKDRFQLLESQSREREEKVKKSHLHQLAEEKGKEINELRNRLEGDIVTLKGDLRRKDLEIEGLKRVLPELEGLRSELRRKEGDSSNMESLRNELMRKSQEIAGLKRMAPEVEALRSELANKNSDVDYLRKELRNKDLELEELRHRSADLEGLRVDLRRKEQDLEGMRIELKRKDSELEENKRKGLDFMNIRAELERKDHELLFLREELARKEGELSEGKERAEKAKRAHQSQVNEDKNREINELKARHERELKGVHGDLDRLRVDLKRREAEIEGLKGELGRKAAELEGLRVEIRKRPQFSINEADVRLKYEAMTTSLEAKIMTLELERDQVKGRIEEYLREIRGLKELNGKLEISIEEMRNEKVKGFDMIAVMNENETLKSKLLDLRRLEIEVRTVEKENEEEKSRLLSEIRSKEEIIRDMKNQKDQIFEEVERLRRSLEEKGHQKIEIESEKLVHTGKVETLQRENQQLQNQVEHLEKQIQRKDEDFTAKYRDFTRKIEELDNLNRSYREAIQRLDMKGSNYSMAIESPIVRVIETSGTNKNLKGSNFLLNVPAKENPLKGSKGPPPGNFLGTFDEERVTYYEKPVPLEDSGASKFRSTAGIVPGGDKNRFENGKDSGEYRKTYKY